MYKIITLMVLLVFSLLAVPSLAKERIYTESQYQKIWCDFYNGSTEVVLPDKTRADCITDKNIIEVDYADKWYEAVGQALHYGTQLHSRKPGIVLIIEEKNDYRYMDRLINVIDEYKLPIDIWIINDDNVRGAYIK